MDHSLTYRQWRLKNIPHRIRLRAVRKQISLIKEEISAPSIDMEYADYGCSNGYITARVAKQLAPCRTVGFDHNKQNLTAASLLYPTIAFQELNLNASSAPKDTYDFVTCFETLEHVGNVMAAVANIVGSLKRGGKGLIVVPIEHGPVGLLKLFIKMCYRYNLSELSSEGTVPDWYSYTTKLLRNERISAFREAGRSGWGTHFGFDFRDVDDALQATGCRFSAYRVGFNRFYEIERP